MINLILDIRSSHFRKFEFIKIEALSISFAYTYKMRLPINRQRVFSSFHCRGLDCFVGLCVKLFLTVHPISNYTFKIFLSIRTNRKTFSAQIRFNTCPFRHYFHLLFVALVYIHYFFSWSVCFP